MNRTRRKAIKMAKRHKRDIYTPRHSLWRALPRTDLSPDAISDAMRQSMREIYNQCSHSDTPRLPDVAFVTGELVNQALGTTDYDPTRGYVVSRTGIEPM